MAFDGVLLYGLARELDEILSGGRIDKIHQPETDEVHITVRNQGNNYKLLLSASANNPRAHLTRQNKTNPLTPPMFCMVLRKHISGTRISCIKQHNMERIMEIRLTGVNELGDVDEKSLVIEIMGRHSNIILINSEGIIVDAVKHVSKNISRVREVLPGRKYVYPPSQDKTNPLNVEAEHVEQVLQYSDDKKSPVELLVKSYIGISTVTAKEICYRGNNNIREIPLAFHNFFLKIKDHALQPAILLDEKDNPVDILPASYKLYPPARLKFFPTFSEALDEFYLMRDKTERLKQQSGHLHRIIKNNLARLYKKNDIISKQLKEAENAEQYRLYGELITANIYQIPEGINQIELVDYYSSDNSMIAVPLDPAKSPAQNAQHYFKIYNKLKRMQKTQSKLLEEIQEEIDYLESVHQHLNACTEENDVMEIKEELIDGGYIKKRSKKIEKEQKQLSSKPLHFVSSDGIDILVGKNNLQNDRLTFKTAHPDDLWLHTKAIQGSHVIIRSGGKPVPDTTLLEAANLAAYYSRGRQSTNVPVDYCTRKHVRKPSRAKPGMVIYDNYKTIYVTPSEERILSMKRI